MDSMEIDDNFYINKNLTMEGIVTKVDFQRRKQPSRCVTVCLGLLCAVLLAGNIGQFIYYEIISRLTSADPTQASLQCQGDRLQDGYDASTAERKQLEAKLSNLTEEKGQLQQSYTALTTERDEFKTSFNNLTNDNEQLQASYYTLKRDSDQLQTSYNNMQKSLEELQANHTNLKATKDQLQTNNRNLQREKDELQTLANRDQLQSDYSSLKRNKDQLQISYNTLSTRKDDLQIRYNSLTNDKDRLQSSYNSLQNDKEQLQNKYNSLVKVKDELEKEINKLRGKTCQTGWSKFEKSCYFLSTEKKNWVSSRADCIAKGADLVIIDSRDEQAFVNGLLTLRQFAWIGLTDSVTEGVWMWADGTPVTTTKQCRSRKCGGRFSMHYTTKYSSFSSKIYQEVLEHRPTRQLRWEPRLWRDLVIGSGSVER
ncbi:uncharacterized protein LOC142964792 [Anarhichas minor]|uniref:uncharacterized protein LOC142964792 n=1 Tax=Anarhichas minor TaxID=65739 RepID=UPI003F7318C8